MAFSSPTISKLSVATQISGSVPWTLTRAAAWMRTVLQTNSPASSPPLLWATLA